MDKNTIAFSGGDGVTIVSATASGNTVWENAICSNAGLGVDLGPDGVTANDAGDVDTGSNNLHNFPVLSAAARNGEQVGVYGDLNASPNAGYIIDFYSNSVCDASGNGEGIAWLGYAIAFADATGEASISGSFSATELVGSFITATATANLNTDGSTSEFSACVEAATLPDLELPEGVSVDEGDTAEYEVTLAEQPSDNATVFLVSVDTGVDTVAASSLPFAVDNWDTAHSVRVNGVDDDASDQGLVLVHSATFDGEEHVLGRLLIIVNDDDLPQLTLSDESVSVDEGATDTYTVGWAAQPTVDVTVSLTSADADAATVSPDTLTFTTTDWGTASTVAVRGIDDDDGAEEAVEITHIASIGGEDYLLGSLFVSVSDDDTAPYFSEGDTASRTVDDGARSGSNVGAAVTATDADPGDTLTYSLSSSGDDHEFFNVDANGQITVASGKTMDYETRPSYSVTLSVHDGKDLDGNADTTIDDTIDVTITVTNLEEAGEITLSWDQPQVDSEITGELEDPDGSIANASWMWASSADGSSNWGDIGGATSESYTPVAADVGS